MKSEQQARTNGARHKHASSGDAHSDVVALWNSYEGDPESAVIVTDPKTASGLAVVRTGDGPALYPDVGPRGGTVLGIPLVTSKSSPRDSQGGQLLMVDASSLVYAEGVVQLRRAEHASIQMLDNPTNDVTTPTATNQVSMWLTDSVAIKATQELSWSIPRPRSVALITGASYV